MIPEIGHYALILGFCFSILLAAMPLVAKISHIKNPQQLGSSLALGQALFVSMSIVVLGWAFYTDDFSVAYVAYNSNTNLPWPYKISAIWGAHEGSMLLWYWILSLWTLAFALYKSIEPKLQAYATFVLGGLCFGFALFIILTSNPFARFLPEFPQNGADLNPLLQDVGLIVHPPLLYLGYVGFAVPFALAVACLMRGTLPIDIAKIMRPWALGAWAFLTLGITLGSWWAYYELGWGGWWFWDPVENASFMPWLAGTALIHSVMVTSKHAGFPRWTILLALLCFSLSLLGTFLVRSGVLTSVHAFATDPLRGGYILKFIAIAVGGALLLYSLRASRFVANRIQLFSRESFILVNNIILFVVTASVLLGTVYPILIDAFLSQKLSVGPPYFNAIFVPFMVVLIFFMGAAPHIRWLKDDIHRHLVPFSIVLSSSLALAFLLPIIKGWPITVKMVLGLFVSIWLFISTIWIVARRVKSKAVNLSLFSMVLAHIGIAFCAAGITLTTHLEVEKDIGLTVGDKVTIGQYDFELKAFKDIKGSNYQGVMGEFLVNQTGKKAFMMYPEKRYFIPREMPLSETAINPGFFRDLYIALGEPISDTRWSVRIYVKPYVRWLWIGGILMALGGFVAASRKSMSAY